MKVGFNWLSLDSFSFEIKPISLWIEPKPFEIILNSTIHPSSKETVFNVQESHD